MEREETKKAFAEAFRKLQTSNPQRRITVKDIASAAGYDRHTFYYHFSGLSDLCSWIFDIRISELIAATGDNWKLVIPRLVEYVHEDKSFVLALYHSSSRDEVEKLLVQKILDLLAMYMENEPGFSGVRDDRKKLIAEFHAGGIVVIFFEWLRSGMEKSPADFTAELISIVRRSLESFQEL